MFLKRRVILHVITTYMWYLSLVIESCNNIVIFLISLPHYRILSAVHHTSKTCLFHSTTILITSTYSLLLYFYVFYILVKCQYTIRYFWKVFDFFLVISLSKCSFRVCRLLIGPEIKYEVWTFINIYLF